jgi:Na+/H+ antiporter NhaD/arsenite permease-like protein
LTPVGSVPNIILNSGARIGFGQWVSQMAIFAILSLIISTAYFLFLHRDFLNKELSDEKKEELEYLDPNQVIDSIKDVYLSTGLIIALVISFIVAEQIHVGIELMAVLLTVSTMIITGIRSKEMWAQIDWNTLFFFSGLFVLVGSLEQSQALLPLSSVIQDLIIESPGLLLILLIFFGGLASTGLNNIPISLLITSIFASIGVVGLQFWYGAVIATNIGASLTPIGSVIVIIAFEVLRKSGYQISISKYFKETFPLFIIISVLGYAYLMLLTRIGVF